VPGLIKSFLVASIAVTTALGCATHYTSTGNPLAAELSREDVASRTGTEVKRSDKERVDLMLDQIARGLIRTPQDKFNAALVLDHSPMTFRDNKLVALSPDNYLLGHYLAKSAFEEGHQPARALVAQTIDRYLSLTTGCQKYGTNRFINQQTGAEELAPVDRNTTDEERARYGVPPLATLLKQYSEQKVVCH